jgi:hypothetical protein
MHAAFPKSGLLITNAEGHTAGAEPSLCRAKAVRRYFQTGKLPDENIVCKVNFRPFLGDSAADTLPVEVSKLTKEDRKLYNTMVGSHE